MRYLKTYRIFEAKTSGLTQEQEEFLNRYTKGRWSYDPATGLVDVVGSFDCSSERLKTLSGVKFGKVSGDFYYEGNQLTTLKGAPQEVGGDFDCQRNILTSLEGAPQEVGGYFYCSGNKLTSLEGAPEKIGGDFSCDVFHLENGGWNPEGWLEILKNGKSEAQSLILTLLTPQNLNQKIQKDPAGMIIKLKEVWNDESFREIRSKLVWPRGYEEEADLVGDLDDIGF